MRLCSHIYYILCLYTVLPSHLDLVLNSPGQDTDSLRGLTYQTVYNRANMNHSANLLAAVRLWFQGEVRENTLRWANIKEGK